MSTEPLYYDDGDGGLSAVISDIMLQGKITTLPWNDNWEAGVFFFLF